MLQMRLAPFMLATGFSSTAVGLLHLRQLLARMPHLGAPSPGQVEEMGEPVCIGRDMGTKRHGLLVGAVEVS